MPRTLPSALAAAIASDTAAISALVRIDRTDGISFGFTSADAPITYGGLTYDPSDSMGSTAIESNAGTGVDNMDVLGVLSSSRITEDDLAKGLYDGATITVRLIDRPSGEATAPILFGYLGGIEITDGTFKAEVRSLSARLKQVVGDVTTRNCRCRRVGDACCRVDMTGNSNGGYPNRVTRTLHASSTSAVPVASSDSAPTGYYAWGTIKVTSGANAGVTRDVKVHTLVSGKAQMTLRQPFPFAFVGGESVVLEVGCDRTMTTCKAKFANANNFHGEWYLPGNDKVSKIGKQ